MINCSSCVEGKKSYRMLCSNKLAFALVSRAQGTKGHSVVLPKRHVATIHKLKHSELIAIHEIIVKTTKMLKKTYGYENFVITTNEGDLLKNVKHLHTHIIPFKKGPALSKYKSLSTSSKKLNPKPLANMADYIKRRSK